MWKRVSLSAVLVFVLLAGAAMATEPAADGSVGWPVETDPESTRWVPIPTASVVCVPFGDWEVIAEGEICSSDSQCTASPFWEATFWFTTESRPCVCQWFICLFWYCWPTGDVWEEYCRFNYEEDFLRCGC